MRSVPALLRVSFLLFGVFGLSVPAGAMDVRVPAAPEHELPTGSSVLLLVGSNAREVFADAFEEALGDRNLGAKDGIRLTELQLPHYRASRVSVEVGLSVPELAALADGGGHEVAAEGSVVFGKVRRQPFTRTERATRKTDHGEERYEAEVRCLRETLEYDLDFRVVDRSGEVLASVSETKEYNSWERCSKAGEVAPSATMQVPDPRSWTKVVAFQQARRIRPHWREEALPMPAGEVARDLGRGAWDDALEKVERLVRDSPYRHQEVSQGVFAAILAREPAVAIALTRYHRALCGDNPDLKARSARLNRLVDVTIKFEARVQGETPSVVNDPRWNGLISHAEGFADLTPPSGEALLLKGRRDVSLHAEPDRRSAQVAVLPVGLLVYRQTNDKRWREVVSPDGRVRGFVKAGQVKDQP